MRSLAALVIAGASLLASAAAAEPTFDLFQKLCVAPAGDRAATLAAAEAMGWKPMPQEMIDSFAKGQTSSQKGTDIEARISMTNGLHAVVVAHVNEIVPGQPVPSEACGVAVAGVDSGALKADVIAFAAVPADPALTDFAAATAFGWRNEGARHVQMTASDLGKAQGRRDVIALEFTATDSFALVGLTTPAK